MENMNTDYIAFQTVMAEAELLHAPAEIEQALDRMAQHIEHQLAGSNPLVLCVLTGGIVVMGALLTRLRFPLEIDYLHLTRYQKQTQGQAQWQWLAYPQTSLIGRTVLVVDDILDEGVTLQAILAYCQQQGATAVYSAVLAHKQHGRSRLPAADFTALTVVDRYVFGYGMDYHGYGRNAPGIFAVRGM